MDSRLTSNRHRRDLSRRINPIANTKSWTLDRDYPVVYQGLGTEPLPDLTVTIADQNYDLPYLFINQTAEFPQIAGSR